MNVQSTQERRACVCVSSISFAVDCVVFCVCVCGVYYIVVWCELSVSQFFFVVYARRALCYDVM